MRVVLFLLVFASSLVLGQNKELFKTISYQDMITYYNSVLSLQDETLDANIERCKYIITNSKEKADYSTEAAFKLFLQALEGAKLVEDKEQPFITIYKDASSYNFYNSDNKFVGRVYKEKFEPQISNKGDTTETYVTNYFNLLQD